MKKFRKKPVIVEAVMISPNPGDAFDAAVWCGGEVVEDDCGIASIKITTLEGTMTGNAGDWIIKGVIGEFYPCKPDIFIETYEEVTP